MCIRDSLFSSVTSFAVDYLLYWLCLGVFKFAPLISYALARLVSSPLNFVLNRNFVFKFKQDTGKTALKYALLCIVTITLSNLGVSLLDHLHIFIGGFAFIPKILMDTLLYLVNYRIQNKWIFAKSAENQEG